MKLLAPGSLPRLTLLLAATVVALHSASGRSTNQQGLKLIKEFEGFYPNYYIDPVGIKTIGYGHACHANSCGPEIKPPLTEAQATELLITDLQRSYEPCVEKAVTVPLNDNQFSALVSFVFNLGCGAFKSSTLLRRLNAKGNNSLETAFTTALLLFFCSSSLIIILVVQQRSMMKKESFYSHSCRSWLP